MNYVLILINYFPEYIKHVINSILSVDKDSKVILCHNSKTQINIHNVISVNLEDLNSDLLDEFNNLNIFKDSIYEENQLWKTSLQRIFYLNEVIQQLDLSNVIHFDNDVIIYKPFSDLESSIQKEKINITPYNLNKFTFGYSFIKDKSLASRLSDETIKFYKEGKKSDWDFNNGKPLNEMEALKSISLNNPTLFHLLPTLPYQNNIIFDPAGYGQYIDGTHGNPKKAFQRGYTSNNDPIGVEITSKRMTVKFKSEPTVNWEGKKFTIANLHVHSKRLDKFLPPNYIKYV